MCPEAPIRSGLRPAAHSSGPGLDFYTMNEDNEPDWTAELAKGGEAMRRQVEPIVKAAEQFVRDARRDAFRAAGGPRSGRWHP